MSERFLVVSATRAEAAHLPDGVPVVITGIGKTAAATATVRALAADPDASSLTVLNVGTAGALHDGLEGLHLPGSVLNHDISAAAIRALGHDPRELLTVPGGDETVLASGDVFVSDPAVRAELAKRAQLVDMEGYAVAYACAELGARVELVKHVSDNADESALDWPALVDASARVLGSWVRERVGRLA
ncbi:nucleosidase [Marmoricola sp. RAF53]|uniref:nucleosidase n=1 Tax=Marmoricola sp. RAF53 TaxID=3233059 RepID=UPI003F9DC91D